MAYTWSKDLETGNAEIDRQHQALIRAVNGLLEACAKGQGRAEVEKTIRFLSDYVIRHFRDEEALQVRYRFPSISEHRQYHEGFKSVVASISDDFQREGATIAFVAKVNHSIAGWLIQHIKKEDVKVAAHIHSVQSAGGL